MYSTMVTLNRFESCIDDLPDEVLEFIISLVPPYKDLQQCSLVCKRWHRSVKNVIRHTKKNMNRAITDFTVVWETNIPTDMSQSITKRYSHSACRYENSMYVFGGCTSSSTTFNDLWCLDLNKRQWVRPLTMGTYPSPKACASMVCYKDALVLFGGWTHPSPYPLHQAWRLFNELHVYGIASNRWTCINTPTTPPAMAGHSASIQGNLMVVFGGLQYGSSNDVWCFNFDNQTWHKQVTSYSKPHSRYGQSQITLNDTNILILGGCGGPNMVFSDVWLLSMTEPVWTWKEVEVRNPEWGASHMWCHPACKMGPQVIVFSRNPMSNAPALPYTAQWNAQSQLRVSVSNVWIPPREDDVPAEVVRRASDGAVELRAVDRDQNVNGRRGTLNPRQSSSGGSASVAASTSSSSGDESESEGVAAPSLNSPRPESSRVNGAPNQRTSPYDADAAGPSGIAMAAFRDPSPALRSNTSRNRQRQLESLRRMEERIRSLSRSNSNRNINPHPVRHDFSPNGIPYNIPSSPSSSPTKVPNPKNAMTMFVLDISHVLSEECYVEWLPHKEECTKTDVPEEKILYTLVPGKGELVMFGGIQKNATSITAPAQMASNISNTVSNSIHFITAPKGII